MFLCVFCLLSCVIFSLCQTFKLPKYNMTAALHELDEYFTYTVFGTVSSCSAYTHSQVHRSLQRHIRLQKTELKRVQQQHWHHPQHWRFPRLVSIENWYSSKGLEPSSIALTVRAAQGVLIMCFIQAFKTLLEILKCFCFVQVFSFYLKPSWSLSYVVLIRK